MKKLIWTCLAAWGLAAVLNAAPIVRIDFPGQNFWGKMECLDELPDGVWVGERQAFYDKKRKGYTFPVFVDLAKVTEFELTFKFEGTGMAQAAPELTGYADDLRKTTVESDIELVDFAVNGAPSCPRSSGAGSGSPPSSPRGKTSTLRASPRRRGRSTTASIFSTARSSRSRRNSKNRARAGGPGRGTRRKTPIKAGRVCGRTRQSSHRSQLKKFFAVKKTNFKP